MTVLRSPARTPCMLVLLLAVGVLSSCRSSGRHDRYDSCNPCPGPVPDTKTYRTSGSGSCEPCDVATCEFKSVYGLNHARACAKIKEWQFTAHPHCHDMAGNPFYHDPHWIIDPRYKHWVVIDCKPEPGHYPCDTVLDLTFVSPK